MPSEDQELSEAFAEFQQRTRELLRAQQDAYLAAVQAWREGVGKGAPSWSAPSPPSLSPNAEELAEASCAFAAKLLADQSRFMNELSKAIGTNDDRKD